MYDRFDYRSCSIDFTKYRRLSGQFLKFGIIGLINTVLSLLIYYGLVALGVNYLVANGVAFVLTVINAYFWQTKYVFEKKSTGHLLPVIKVYTSYGFSFLVSTVLLYLMVGILGISAYIAPVLNLFVTVPLNFCLNKFWVYKG